MPNNYIASAITSFLILKSKGVSVEKLGAWFISINQGFNFSSMRTSNPNISKHIESTGGSFSIFLVY